MLTHHLQDPNCDAAQLIKSGAMSINTFAGKFTKYDLNDGSFSSERAGGKSNLEKIEKEISRLMERNNGQLFKVEYERNGYSKDDMKSAGYYSDDEFAANSGERPIFKIKYKPRARCHLH
jgi:hypothetical protein